MRTNRSKESVETYNKAAKNYQEKVMGIDLYNDTYDKFCALIDKKNPEILEVACGPGNVTKYLYSKRIDFKILVIDLAPSMIELAKINNPQADFKVMDCRNIEKLDKIFDAILCGFCMPYLSKQECNKMIADFSKLLKPEGVLYFSTMEDDYDKSGFETTSFSGQDRVYIYYHQADFLTECLISSGLNIIDFQRKDCPEPDGTFFTDMIFIARKNNN
jgi:ubiquinone/menaquinone biosynthesis C-methylase UbiE